MRTKTDLKSVAEFESSLRQNKFSPLYLFYGEEDWLIQEAVDLLIHEAIDESTRSFNLDILYGSNVDAKEVISVASSYPMMAERRVVVVREFDRLPDKDLLIPFIDRPLPSTCLVMISSKPDFRQRLYKAIEHKGTVIECRQFHENEIPAWIQKRVEGLGKKIMPQAVQLLQTYVGRSLREIQNEIEKLFIYIGEKSTIHSQDVSEVVGMSKQYNIFELQKALGQKNMARSVEILERMLDAGEYPVAMIVMLTRYFQRIWLLQELRRESLSAEQLAVALRVRPFFIREYSHGASNYTAAELEQCFASLLEADEDLKFTSKDPKLVMTLLVYRILHPEQSVALA